MRIFHQNKDLKIETGSDGPVVPVRIFHQNKD